MELLRRAFTVEAPLQVIWDHLAAVTRWPGWARHIARIEVEPPGALGPTSRGRLQLTNGVTSVFAVTEWDPPRHWAWSGPFLWLTVRYDHRFEPVDDRRTRLTWVVEAQGLGVAVFGRLFAAIYGRNLDRAIPRLQAATAADAHGPGRAGLFD